MIQPLWRAIFRFFTKLKIELPYDLAIPCMGIFPKKIIIQKDAFTPVFTAALLKTSRTGKQHKCQSTEEWIKIWYTYTLEYYSAIKKDEIMPFIATWMDLESVILNEVREGLILYDMPYDTTNLFTKQKKK